MQKEKLSREAFLEMFREDVIRLSRYTPWFEKKSGDDVSRYYEDGDKMKHTLSFPVYDSILLSFLNDASTTVFMEQNYHYFYTRNRIQDYEDELRLIETADIMHMEALQCVLSRYVFGGMTKAYLWKDGVDHKIFLNILKKARQIIEFWEQPLIIEDEIIPEDEEETEEETVFENEEGAIEEVVFESQEEIAEETVPEIEEETAEEEAPETEEEITEEEAPETEEETAEEEASETEEETAEEEAPKTEEETAEEEASETEEETAEEEVFGIKEEITEEEASETEEEITEDEMIAAEYSDGYIDGRAEDAIALDDENEEISTTAEEME